MNFKTLDVEVRDFVATITMNRPPVNALNRELQSELTAAFDMFSDKNDVRAVILTGAGKAFCAGVDMKQRASKPFEQGERWENARSFREAKYAILDCKKPVIAAINGAAVGGGLGIVSCCDILVASTAAQMALPEIDVGLLGGYRSGMRLFGHSRLRWMLLTGGRVDGAELYRLGVVERCVAPAELMGVALQIASKIASKSPEAIRLAKQSANAVEDMSFREGYRFEQNMTAELSRHEDSKEAMQAFVERRPPRFKVDR